VWRTEASGFETWEAPSYPSPSASLSESESVRPGTRSTKTVSSSGSDSFQTERDVGEVDHSGVCLRPAPSLHETHFSSSNETLPLTILHPSGIPVHLPGRLSKFGGSVSYLEPYWRKPSSTRSEGGPFCRDTHSLSSRPVSALDIYTTHLPQRVSTPTCPGSKNSLSLFHCPHDCFSETDVTEETIEEMDEEDLDSLNRLVRQGLDIETELSSESSVGNADKPKKSTAVTSL